MPPKEGVRPLVVVPPIRFETSLAALNFLSMQLQRGLLQRSFDQHVFTLAPKPITITGDQFDLGHVVDTILVQPTIDTRIEFDREVTDQTPPIVRFQIHSADYKARVIHYKSVYATETGQLSVWAYWYSPEVAAGAEVTA